MTNLSPCNPAYIISLPGNTSDSGKLSFWENLTLFPEGIQRCFWISEVADGETRGNHAHWEESQVLVAVAAKVEVEIVGINGKVANFKLERNDQGLFIPPLNWVKVSFLSGAVLLGMSDRAFSEEDYIRDYGYFKSLREKGEWTV